MNRIYFIVVGLISVYVSALLFFFLICEFFYTCNKNSQFLISQLFTTILIDFEYDSPLLEFCQRNSNANICHFFVRKLSALIDRTTSTTVDMQFIWRIIHKRECQNAGNIVQRLIIVSFTSCNLGRKRAYSNFVPLGELPICFIFSYFTLSHSFYFPPSIFMADVTP